MTTGATGQLGLALPVQGELSGTWGDTVNNGITQYTNIAIAATLTLTNDGAVTLANTTGDATASNIVSSLTGAGTVTAQFAIVRVTGTLTTAKVITAPSYSKTYTVVNAATGGIVTFKASGQTGVSIAVGESAFVYFNGTDYVKVSSTAAGAAGGSDTQVQFNSSGALAGSSNLVFDGTNLGVGGAPSAWNTSNYRVVSVGDAGLINSRFGISTYNIDVGVNWYRDSGGSFLYKNTGFGSNYLQQDGAHRWYTAPSGTAGTAISLSEIMTLTAAGNLGIGTSSPSAALELSRDSADVGLYITRSSTGASNYRQFIDGDGDIRLSMVSSKNMRFFTNDTERMRLTSAGSLVVGGTEVVSANGGITATTTSSGGIAAALGLRNAGTSNGSGTSLTFRGVSNVGAEHDYAYVIGAADDTTAKTGSLRFATTAGSSPVERARIYLGFSVGTTSDPGAGAIYATGNITAFFSDKRLKTVSGKIENALDKVAKLSGVYYTFNDTAKSFGYDSDEVQVGVIAQEVEAVLPQIVKAAPFDLDENNNSKSGENYKTVQYDKLVPLLIEAINELQAKVKALEAK